MILNCVYTDTQAKAQVKVCNDALVVVKQLYRDDKITMYQMMLLVNALGTSKAWLVYDLKKAGIATEE